ncbi:MAG TPA: TssN family type VI secretion system protein [Bacteroidia bacterium]|nr:TssN family type VI secretion system protein [Bacteroidia bacterium]
MNAKNIFVTHLLLPIVSAIATTIAFILNKKNAFLTNKKFILFVLISSLIIALPALLNFIDVLFIPQLYIITQLLFFILGYFYMTRITRMFSSENETANRVMSILSTLIILSFGSYVFSLLFNFAGDFKYGLIASTSTYTFVLPLFFRWTYISLNNIPTEIHKVWKYQMNYNEPEFSSEIAERIMVLELELTKKASDTEVVKVKAKAPTDLLFGEWFQLFLIDYNSKYFEQPIKYQNENGELYNWIFYVKPSIGSGKKYIDYEKKITDNKLNEKITILCKRVDKMIIN